MKNLSQQTDILIQEELSLINKKINSVLLLEILKYKIIDKLKTIYSNENLKESKSFNITNQYEDEFRKIEYKIESYESPSIHLNTELKTDFLLISLKEVININIEDYKNKKKFDYKCIPNTGIVLPKTSRCSLNYSKNSISLEISSKDKMINIEKSEENTI